MGLDVYVGPLSRYYAGDWETIVQQEGRRQGIEVQVIRPPVPRQMQDPSTVAQALQHWQRAASSRLVGIVPGGIAWDESPEADYITDKPDWGPYSAMAAIATDDDMPNAAPPDHVAQGRQAFELWKRLRSRYVPVRYSTFTSRLRHFLGEPRPPVDNSPRRYASIVVPELWIPGNFPDVLELRDLRGNRVAVGSVGQLLDELEFLDARRLRLDEPELDRRKLVPPETDELDPNARFAFTMMLDLTREASTRRLPMVLDY